MAADPSTPHDENTPALYSTFCGVVAVPTAFVFIGVFFGVMALILGRAGLRRADAGEGRRGLAGAGLALGVIAIVLEIALLAS